MQLSLEGGFADPVFASQAVFRAMMDALANPGQKQALVHDLRPPKALAPALAAIALTICDHDTRLWLDPALAGDDAVLAWLRFHTAAPMTSDPATAHFALAATPSELPEFDRFSLGTDEYPDRSTTIVVSLSSLTGGDRLTLCGPGIRDRIEIAPAGLPVDFPARWAANTALFPRGVDLLLVTDTEIVGLPRTTRVTLEAI